MDIENLSTDVLILGSGLAGMRAAMAALDHGPDLNILVAGTTSGPSGSSFSNANNMLGVQVLETDEDRAAFTDEVMGLAGSGFADRSLVELMAFESVDRFQDLKDLGLSFKSNGNGGRLKVPGCFSPSRDSGRVFTNTAGAHGLFMAALKSRGVNFLGGRSVRALIGTPESGICGAVLEDIKTGREVRVRAGAVVAALGGPAPLFERNLAGSGTSGDSYGLLARAGATLRNAGFIQFIWTDLSTGKLWPAGTLAHPDARVRTPDGRVLSVRHDLPRSLTVRLDELARMRHTHCPAGYSLDDTVLDMFLADNIDNRGRIRLYDPKAGWIEIAPTAQAGNGGAVIDEHAQTGVPGLFACGECATGMHGANRIGGAMVLATQVFGERAGRFAVQRAREVGRPSMDLFMDARSGLPIFAGRPEKEDAPHIAWLMKGMQRYTVLGGRAGLASFHARLQRKALNIGGPLFKLRADAALAVTAHLIERMNVQTGKDETQAQSAAQSAASITKAA